MIKSSYNVQCTVSNLHLGICMQRECLLVGVESEYNIDTSRLMPHDYLHSPSPSPSPSPPPSVISPGGFLVAKSQLVE